MPRRLEIYEVQQLLLIGNVQRSEVKRYLTGMDLSLNSESQLKQMKKVAKANGWSRATREAVMDGLWKAYSEDEAE